MKKVLQVPKVAFHWSTGDNRSPESYPLPACMTSLMETLGDGFGNEIIHAHNREYLLRRGNREFLTASGMAFGLLWSDELCMSALDLTQVAPDWGCVRRAFDWVGYGYEIIENRDIDAETIRAKIIASIDRGAPVLAFNLFDPPECAIVAGYDGDALIGWSHFQEFAQLPTEEMGMFRVTGWEKDWWAVVLPGAKTGTKLTLDEVLRFGLSVMRQTSVEDYRAGEAAYDAWLSLIASCENADDEAVQARFNYHHSVLFSVAELRCWGGDFMLSHGAQAAGNEFKRIHDLCWAADAVTRADGWKALQSAEEREKVLEVLREIRACDARAREALAEIVEK